MICNLYFEIFPCIGCMVRIIIFHYHFCPLFADGCYSPKERSGCIVPHVSAIHY